MRPLKTFIIYARKDESFKDDLLLHLKGTLIETRHLEVWQDGAILPGEEWEKAIEKQLEAAEIFLVLLSIHSLTSEFIRKKELVKALEKEPDRAHPRAQLFLAE
ncbi:MAG: toll/interleukin-1 receptor domain-containing protein [Lewinellaceae bacterium]|nr:toll/interleukin-1 receptor domain-containing protein [Lewinellaceae bacterium]